MSGPQLNGEQMTMLANEFADRMLERLRSVLPEGITDKQRDILQSALGLAWLEGFGRGTKDARKIAEDALEKAVARITAAALETITTPAAP